jgi:hypothetical protein
VTVGVALTAGAPRVAAGPSGRVVRVERTTGANVAPRLCEVRSDAGTCIGEEPRVGQSVFIVTERGVTGEAQIVEAASAMTSCANLWSVKMRIVHGDVPGADGIGVIDPGLDPRRARVLDKAHLPPSPSGQPGDEVWRAIDRDGDGAADIVFTHYACDPSGAMIAGGSEYCLDIWAHLRTRMVRTTQLNFAKCNL